MDVLDTVLLWGIRLVHLAIVVLVIVSVFLPSCILKEIALIILLYLLIQYIMGKEICCLTKIEYAILGEDKYQKGFMYRLINPMIRVPENYFNNGLFIFHIIWIFILCFQVFRNMCK